MSSSGERQTGSIKWYDHKKGYGFIKADIRYGSRKLFFHHSALASGWNRRDIALGGYVEFSVERDEVGRLRAVQVTRFEGTCFGCGKLGHRVKDCKSTPTGLAVFCNRCGRWGHKTRGSGDECYHCGELRHIAVDRPRKQMPSSPRDSTIGRVESSKEQGRYARMGDGLPDGGAGNDDDGDDCVILENNPFVGREKQSRCHLIMQRKLFMDFINDFSDLYSGKICKHEKDSDEEESNDDCVPVESKQEEESDDDCIILDKNPFEEDVHETIINISKKLHLRSDVGTMVSVQKSSPSKLPSLQVGLDHDELVIVAEKGQVACRDYPHSRHLCVTYPFKNTLHQSYCNLCYCYVCDTRAPCKHWDAETDGHCHASEQEKWIEMRVTNRTKGSWIGKHSY